MRAAPRLSEADWIAIEREACRRSLVEFVRSAWRVLEPGQPYVHGWHVDAVAEHLQAITEGQITRLLINIPPGTMKSMLCGVFWPAWEWGPRGMPHIRFIGASHEQGLAIRENEIREHGDRIQAGLRRGLHDRQPRRPGELGRSALGRTGPLRRAPRNGPAGVPRD